METHEIRREYVAPHLIPQAYKGPQNDIIRFEVHRFKYCDIAAPLMGTEFGNRTADALTVYRRVWRGCEEMKRIKAETGKNALPWKETKFYRVIAFNGEPVKMEETTDLAEALRAAVIKAEAGNMADALRKQAGL